MPEAMLVESSEGSPTVLLLFTASNRPHNPGGDRTLRSLVIDRVKSMFFAK